MRDIGFGFEYPVPILLKTEIKNGIGFVLLLLGLATTVYGARANKKDLG